MLRFILPVPENNFLQINEEGQLEGQMKPLVEEALYYLMLKFNMTWIPIRKDAQTSDDVTIEGVKMIGQNEADLARGCANLINGLPENVPIGIVNYNAWCKIASSPAVTSSVLTHGPESALKKMKMEFLIFSLIGLLLMIYLALRKATDSGRKFSPTWILYATLVRKHVNSILEKGSIQVYTVCTVLLLATFLIQILFSSLLHTERTSISSFLRIDSFKDAEFYGMKKFVLDLSSCPKILEEKQNFEVISFASAYLSGENYQWCASSDRCTLLITPTEADFLRSFMCSLDPEITSKSPVHLSSTMAKMVIGHFSNRRMPKKKQNKMNSYIQRAFEMGIEHEKGVASRHFGKKTVKATTQLDVNEECFSDLFRASFSTPVPLNTQFFMHCFILYMGIIIISLLLHLHAILKPYYDSKCTPKLFF